MRTKYAIIFAAALMAAALLCGCDRTADGTATEKVAAVETTCPQSGQEAVTGCDAVDAACSGCPAMEGTGTGGAEATSEAGRTTCPHADAEGNCPEGCTCEKVLSADGTLVCAHASDCPHAGGECTCPGAATEQTSTGCTHAAATEPGSCPGTCSAAKTCPKSGGNS